jgi:ribosomal protein S12 methylthiotransferase accessory factor
MITGARPPVDTQFGPISGARRQRLGTPEPRWWLSTVDLARTPVGNPFMAEPAAGSGTSLSAQEATDRAIGEAMERMCGLAWLPELRFTTLAEAGLSADWARCAAEEDAPESLKTPPPDTPVLSVAANRLADGADLQVPAAHVLLGYRPPPEEPMVAISISTGLAFHPDPVQAVWNGVCEVLERDAITSAWWIHQPVAEIRLDDHSPHGVVERVARFADAGMDARLYDISTEVSPPTVFCVLRSPRSPRLVVGAATKASAASACCKALDEALSMRIALASEAAPEASPGAKPSTLIEHARYYAESPDHAAFDFLGAAGTMSFSELAAESIAAPSSWPELTAVGQRLAADGLNASWVDVTVPEVRPYGTSMRVVIPELVPLSPTHGIRWLGTTRLLQRAAGHGGFRSFTDHPHPFA